MSQALSDSDSETQEEPILYASGLNLFERHAQVLARGTPNTVLASLAALREADLSSPHSRNLFYQAGGHQALMGLLTHARQADLGSAPARISGRILSECVTLICFLASQDNLSRVLLAGPVGLSPDKYNARVVAARQKAVPGPNLADYVYTDLNTGIALYTALALSASADACNRNTAVCILTELFRCTAPRRIFNHFDGPARMLRLLRGCCRALFTGDLFTRRQTSNLCAAPDVINLCACLLCMLRSLCASGASRKLLRDAGVTGVLICLMHYESATIYEPAVQVLGRLVARSNSDVLADILEASSRPGSDAVRRICGLILPGATTTFLRAAASILAKVANTPGGDTVVTRSGGIQPLIDILAVTDRSTLTAACQVIVGISQRNASADEDCDAAESNAYTVNHAIIGELIGCRAIAQIHELLTRQGASTLEKAPGQGGREAPGQRRNPRSRQYKLRGEAGPDLFAPAPTEAHTQADGAPASTLSSGESQTAGLTGMPVPLARWSNLTAWLLHALSNLCPSELAAPHFRKDASLLPLLLAMTGSCNPCVIRWSCQCLANLARHPDVAKALVGLGGVETLFSVIRRAVSSPSFEEDYGKLSKALVISSAAEGLSGLLEDPGVAKEAGQTVCNVFTLIVAALRGVTNGRVRAWLCGMVARMCRCRGNAAIFLENNIVEYLLFLALEAGGLAGLVDLTLREQVSLAIAHLCTSMPLFRDPATLRRGSPSTSAVESVDADAAADAECRARGQAWHMLTQEYVRYGQHYGENCVIAEFGNRGAIASICSFLAPQVVDGRLQRLTLQELSCLRAASMAASVLSVTGRNALLFYRDGAVDRLIYLIAVGDRATQQYAGCALRNIRLGTFEIMSCLRSCGRGGGDSRIGVYTRSQHRVLLAPSSSEPLLEEQSQSLQNYLPLTLAVKTDPQNGTTLMPATSPLLWCQ